MDEKMLQDARAQFGILKKMLDQMDVTYHADEEDLILSIPKLMLTLALLPQTYTMILLSDKLLTVNGDKRIDIALAVCAINQCFFRLGGFDYNIQNGALYFRVAQHYYGSSLSESSINFMLASAAAGIKDHLGKLRQICDGTLSLQELYQEVL